MDLDRGYYSSNPPYLSGYFQTGSLRRILQRVNNLVVRTYSFCINHDSTYMVFSSSPKKELPEGLWAALFAG